MKFIVQLVVCVALLAGGVLGFMALKNAKEPTGTSAVANTGAEASATPASDDKTQSNTSAPTASPTKPVAKPWPVAVESISKSAISPTVTLFGTVETPRQTKLTAAINADVIDVNVLEGQRVGKGESLVELDAADIRLNITQRKAELAEIEASVSAENRRHEANLESLVAERELLTLSKRQLERYQKLAERQIGTRAAADDAARAVKQQELVITNRQNAIDDHATTVATFNARRARAEAQLQQSERNLQRTLITAPFTGVVTAVAVSPGDRVLSSSPLVTMYDTSFVEVRAQIPNRHVPTVERALAAGQTISATGSIEGAITRLRLDRLAAVARSGSGGVDGLLRVVDDSPPSLGRTLNVVLDLPAIADAFAVPSGAIKNNNQIFVVRDNKLASVTISRSGDVQAGDGTTRALVTSPDVVNGDRIVVSQVPSARDGMAVQVTAPDQ